MTKQERDIDKLIRTRAWEVRERGKYVKSGYQKLFIDGKVWKSNKEKGELEEENKSKQYTITYDDPKS